MDALLGVIRKMETNPVKKREGREDEKIKAGIKIARAAIKADRYFGLSLLQRGVAILTHCDAYFVFIRRNSFRSGIPMRLSAHHPQQWLAACER
jgi:hypothetical protein